MWGTSPDGEMQPGEIQPGETQPGEMQLGEVQRPLVKLFKIYLFLTHIRNPLQKMSRLRGDLVWNHFEIANKNIIQSSLIHYIILYYLLLSNMIHIKHFKI